MPTDAIALLEQDHRDLEQIFKKLEAQSGDVEALVSQAADDFQLHAAIEEEIVYPAIKQAAPDESEEVDDGLAEHQHAREAWAEVKGMSSDEPGYDGLIAAVIGELRHHHEEEEEDIFPAWRKAVDRSQLEEIGRRVEERKAQEGKSTTTSGALVDLSKEELYERAKQAGIEGRSDMTKDELLAALERA